jgi:hypothetical protein
MKNKTHSLIVEVLIYQGKATKRRKLKLGGSPPSKRYQLEHTPNSQLPCFISEVEESPCSLTLDRRALHRRVGDMPRRQ